MRRSPNTPPEFNDSGEQVCVDCKKPLHLFGLSARARRCPACRKADVNARASAWYEENKDKKRDYDEKRREENRDYFRKISRRWAKNNPGKARANLAKRRKAIRDRTPSWADKEKIGEVYANRPDGMEVDHIVPLIGETVSGLHVHWNLQYLTPEENRIKSNKLHYQLS